MTLTHYGFIVKAPGYSADSHSLNMDSEHFHTMIVGVSSLDEAIVAAKKMVADGIQVIELCGGFGTEDRELLIQAVDSEVPVGSVSFSKSEKDKLTAFLAQP
ncbi:DUF6506 family protein [Pleionea sp. CnH1-48]|uniref:DUF6506 family protein n=1 Tax=Pleionea sp. CnH1-48 TaxID=2954494 RepID=UPI00209807F5|nr:DUF6506 family protein [Pleionea sp. CnH1-48]MCO7227315.1 DUF6506 family protein [Pleionea sp. CnH1-48]